MNQELEQRINNEIPKDDSTSLGEKMILYWMIKDLKPKVVVETGTHRGLTTLYMLAALEDNGEGHLYTCDPNTEWGQNGNFGKFPTLDKRVTFYPIKGEEMLKNINNIDFAFIDGFHGKDDVIPEIKNLLPNLSSTAVVVFHDCWYGNTEGVNEACDELGLKTIWLGTKNAIRIYEQHPNKPTGL